MTLKAEPQKMSIEQTIIVILVGAGALMWGALGVFDYHVIENLAAGYPQVQTVAYGALGAAGGIFLVEIFTETEILNIIDK